MNRCGERRTAAERLTDDAVKARRKATLGEPSALQHRSYAACNSRFRPAMAKD
jgi:hypothetical protein